MLRLARAGQPSRAGPRPRHELLPATPDRPLHNPDSEVSMSRQAVVIAAIAAAAALDLAASAASVGWPQWRGPNRDGVSTETGLLRAWPAAGPTLAWKASGLGSGFSSVSVVNGRVFTMG